MPRPPRYGVMMMIHKEPSFQDNPHIVKRYFHFTTERKDFNKRPAAFKFEPFSNKQMKVLTWWRDPSPVKDNYAIICDGSVRAGKTLVMSLSYVMWAMHRYNGKQFGLAGKTVGSFRRNVVTDLKRMLRGRGYLVQEKRSENFLLIRKDGRTNRFYIFGGRDESSQTLVQGITLAGFFFDEVALMPESFVNQATARCSVSGAKLWFNCNPDGPYHWFKEKWLDNLEQKKALHIHFTMDDNLSLDPATKERYQQMYTGLFYKRFILGLWVMSEGIIYDGFDESRHVVDQLPEYFDQYYVSVDYGTKNPTAFGLWGKSRNKWFKMKEYHHDGRNSGRQKTDVEYSRDLKAFTQGIHVSGVIVDPSAASFITQLKQDGFYVKEAKNAVLDGIRNVSTALQKGMIFFHRSCKETFREFSSYVWDEKAAIRGEDKPVKQNDHHMDADRYFVNTMLFGPVVFMSGKNAF